MSLSWVLASTPVFYNRSSANEQIPAIILGPLQRPGDYLRLQYEVKVVSIVAQLHARMHLDIYMLHINLFPVYNQDSIGLQETDVVPISWLFS